jgi:hypothetical protein
MRRRFPILLAAVAPIALLVAGNEPIAGANDGGARTASVACSVEATIEITHLAFKPSPVIAGDATTAYLVAQNCTNKVENTSTTWVAEWIDTRDIAPTNCPVIDPFGGSAKFKPYGTYKMKATYDVRADCTASALRVTVKISKGGIVLAKRPAQVQIVHSKT